MTLRHRGYKIDVNREKSLGGWSQLYYSIFRRDGLECTSGFCDCNETEARGRDRRTEARTS